MDEDLQADRLPDEPADESQASGEQSQESQPEQGKEDESNDKDDGEAESEGEGDGKRRRASGYQRLKRRVNVVLAENAELHRQLEEFRRRANADGGNQRADAQEEQPPQEADFNGDMLAYERALTSYHVRQAAKEAVRAELSRKDADEAGRRQIEARRARIDSYNEALEDARERIEDFDQAMTAMKGVEVRPDIIDEIMGSEKGPLIAYHLAKNPAELADLNAMSGREIARAIGQLEGRLSLPRAKAATRTPPPPTLPRGGASAAPDPSKMSMKEYEAWRTKGGGR